MYKKWIVIYTLLLILIPGTGIAIPSFLNHQGTITQSDGQPLTGIERITFSLNTQANGGSVVWSEQLDVVLDAGAYSVVLGAESSLSAELFGDNPLYLGVKLQSADEFSPRSKITAVPYAFSSASVTDKVNAEGGLFVGNTEIIDSDGNITPPGYLDLPKTTFGELPSASEQNKGRLYFTTDQNKAYYSNGSEWVELAGGGSGNSGDLQLPEFTEIDPVIMDPDENPTLTITGRYFQLGVEVVLNNIPTETEFINSTTLQVTTQSLESGFYTIRIINPDGLRATEVDGLLVDSQPEWVTSEGLLGRLSDAATGDHYTLEATDPEETAIIYTLWPNGDNFPPGLSMNSDTGVISGDPDDVESEIEYTFTVRAEDEAGSYVDREFTIFINDIFGQDPSTPGDSCNHLMSIGSSLGDGIYWIDPDGEGGADAFQIFCDMTTDGGGWTLVHSSNGMNGSTVEQGRTTPVDNLTTLTPSSIMAGVYTRYDTVSNFRVACDADRNGSNDVDYYYSNPSQVDTMYQMFKNASGDGSFLGTSQAGNFRSVDFHDVISDEDGVSAANTMYWENSNGDTGDFMFGTAYNPSRGHGDSHCYGANSMTSNCWGAYDGRNNMCQRIGPPGNTGYATARTGYWYLWVR